VFAIVKNVIRSVTYHLESNEYYFSIQHNSIKTIGMRMSTSIPVTLP